MGAASVRKRFLEVRQLRFTGMTGLEPGGALHRRVPVGCPDAIAHAPSRRPVEHAFAEGDAEQGAERTQYPLGILEHVFRIQYRRRPTEPARHLLEDARLLLETQFP